MIAGDVGLDLLDGTQQRVAETRAALERRQIQVALLERLKQRVGALLTGVGSAELIKHRVTAVALLYRIGLAAAGAFDQVGVDDVVDVAGRGGVAAEHA
jgi:hypothetical protein